jgi:hypothetical protein
MSKKRKQYASCPNCGHNLQDAHFCPECGQPNHDLNVPLRHLLGELLESTLHLDSKSFKTIAALLLKPGFLTMQFNAGKRQSYVPPLRLYIFISFIFFFLFAIHPNDPNPNAKKEPVNFTIFSLSSEKFKGLSGQQIDSLLAVSNIDTTSFNKYIAHQMGKMTDNPSEITHMLVKNISYMMFVLMPLSAFFIFLLHRKRVRYYLECLIFSIHYHSLIFMLLSLFILTGMIIDPGIVLIIVLIYSLAYLFMSLKRVFLQNTLRAFYKTVILALLAPISIGISFIITIIISIMLY